MTTATSGDALSPRVDAVEKELREVHAGLAAGRRTRLGVLLLVLLFVAGVLWVFSGLYRRVTSEEFSQALADGAREHLELNQAIYRDHAQRLVDHSTPILQQAFSEQVEKDMPLYTAALDEQRQVLIENLRPELERLLNERYAEVLATYQQRLADEFPEAQDPEVQERMVAGLQRAMEGLVEDYYIDQFQVRLDEMHVAWSEFPIADPPGEGDDPISTQLIGILLEILTRQLTGSSSPDEAVL